ncbi:MAG: ferric reductase-like transmembrane domain-containing protein [Anaerolineae bacterium]|nr:ferric reductase-like transmembrane domain-containing protein [Anaerolineae bacterium]
MELITFFNIGWQRWRSHGLLALFTLAGCYIIHLYSPYADLNYIITLACGYISLILIVFSLLIGPYKLLYLRKNPVNLDLRRDVGIWAGINGCLHVAAVLLARTRGDVIFLFLRPKPQGVGYDLLMSPQGISNNLGLVATFILILLLVLSNDISLKYFKGKRWKFLQRFNYGLVVLAFIHTVLYQRFGNRARGFVILTLVLAVAVLVIQAAGFFLYNRNASRMKNHHRVRQQ